MKKLVLLVGFFVVSMAVSAQVTKADYARADSVLHLNKYLYAASVQPKWIAGTHSFWYMNHERGGDFYYMIDAVQRQ
ncbi:hypothetical protein LJC38_05015, partial [Parabacteroides sp. OttesenSCG-928-K15]|nr:hypothetical protein [Parabacteroides sp. OttesenSCG-928-K15]